MTIERRVCIHDGPGGPFESMAVADTTPGKRPGILLVPNFLGTKEEDFIKAEQVAALGYAVLVADVFGQGKRAQRDDPDRARYMNMLNADRALLKARLIASLDALKAMAEVDAEKIGAIGFCFGGKSVLDIARAGLGAKGVVSFHGVYDPPNWALATPISTKILICHGWDDPLSPPDATVALAEELTKAGADWQLHAYSHTSHAFTDRTMPVGDNGIGYQPDADRRSWQAMQDFLKEIFSPA